MPVDLDPLRSAFIVAAAGGAGFINAIVGSGTLISFPALLAVGYESVPANMANSNGLFPGSISAVHGYRRELSGQRSRMRRLVPMSALGAVCGALLLLVLPSSAFRQVVPFLILLGVALVIVQPRLQRKLRARQGVTDRVGETPREHIAVWVLALVFLTGVYGGYFGAGQGVILTGLLGSVLVDDLVRVNALKNVLAAVVNGVAGVVFTLRGGVPWGAAALVAIGSVVGAQVGALVGRRIPPTILRTLIAVIGVIVALRLLLS